MGAKGTVSVVQLIMQDTMEQELRSYVNNGHNGGGGGSTSDSSSLRATAAAAAAATARASQLSQHDSRASAAAHALDTPKSPVKSHERNRDSQQSGSKRKRLRSGGPRSSSSRSMPISSQQDHAKVHFLLTSLRSSRSGGVLMGGDGSRRRDDLCVDSCGEEGGEEETNGHLEHQAGEEDSVEEWDGNGMGKGKGKGKGKGRVARRAVAFAGDFDGDEKAPQQRDESSNANGVHSDGVVANPGNMDRTSGGRVISTAVVGSGVDGQCTLAGRVGIDIGGGWDGLGVKRRRVMFADSAVDNGNAGSGEDRSC